jgi:hypothetical protein
MMEEDVDITIMVVHLLDNNIYMVDTSGGEERLPSKGSDGKNHIEGWLTVAGCDAIKELFCTILPIMNTGETQEDNPTSY